MALGVVDIGFGAGADMDGFDVALLALGVLSDPSPTGFSVNLGGEKLIFTGSDFTFDGLGSPVTGVISGIDERYQSQLAFSLRGLSVAVGALLGWAAADDNLAAKTAIFAGADTLTGGPLDDLLRAYGGADSLSGGAGADTLDAGAGNDILDGGSGGDLLTGGGGSDQFMVGLGQSTLAHPDAITDWVAGDSLHFAISPTGAADYAQASAADYAAATSLANGLIATGEANLVAVSVGADVVVFADSGDDNGDADDAVVLRATNLAALSLANFNPLPNAGGPGSAPAAAAQVVDPLANDGAESVGLSEISSVLRVFSAAGLNTAFVTGISTELRESRLTPAQAIFNVVREAIGTTSVATLSYQFFTGHTPSAGGIDFLVSQTGGNPFNLNSSYFQSLTVENRFISFAVNLGLYGDGHQSFAADYGALSMLDTATKAYTTIFGSRPSDAKAHALIDGREAYFSSLAGAGADQLGAKAAFVGWLLAEAAKSGVGDYAISNEAFLTDVGLHDAPFGVDIIARYDQPAYHYLWD